MKLHRKIIQEEIKRLKEDKYPIPFEIQAALEEKLKMSPIIRYVDHIKAVNSIPPSYEIVLHNKGKFLMFYEDFSLMVKVEGREYYIIDMEERNNAIEHINRILVPNAVQPIEEPEEETEEEVKKEDEPAPEEPVADEEEMI